MNDIAKILFKAHSHAEIENEENPSQIVYTEKALLNILKYLGYDAEPDWTQEEGDVDAICALPDFTGEAGLKAGDAIVLKPHVEFSNLTQGKEYIIKSVDENADGVWYTIFDDGGIVQTVFADQIQSAN